LPDYTFLRDQIVHDTQINQENLNRRQKINQYRKFTESLYYRSDLFYLKMLQQQHHPKLKLKLYLFGITRTRLINRFFMIEK